MVEDQGLNSGADSPSFPAVAVRGLHRRFGDTHALRGFDLDIASGEFISILGPSGCGKTTLLRIIAGFEFADEGSVSVDGRNMDRVPAHKRPVNTVFQRYALFPHMTVAENVGYPLRIARRKKAEVNARVEEMLRLVRLEGFNERSPNKLSGGQAQRVALARALISDPKVLLLDEPLAALDLKLRQAMHFELRRIQAAVGSTFVYVTHDQEEALTMSDRIVVMKSGAIEQVGSPIEVYSTPATRYVSEFIGEVNLLEGEACSSRPLHSNQVVSVSTPSTEILVTHLEPVERGATVWVSVRPEQMTITSAGSPRLEDTNRLEGTLEGRVFLGAFVRHLVRLENGPTIIVQTDPEPRFLDLDLDSNVAVEWPATSGVLLCK